MSLYRECVRNIWNLHFLNQKPELVYDLKEKFDDICALLFSSLVLSSLGCEFLEKAKAYQPIQQQLDCLIVTPISDSGVPVMVNRDVKPSGYWDYPVNTIKPGDVDMRFIDCFDFGQYQFREFEYFQVRIVGSTRTPDLVGRDALIKATHAKVLYSEKNLQKFKKSLSAKPS